MSTLTPLTINLRRLLRQHLHVSCLIRNLSTLPGGTNTVTFSPSMLLLLMSLLPFQLAAFWLSSKLDVISLLLSSLVLLGLTGGVVRGGQEHLPVVRLQRPVPGDHRQGQGDGPPRVLLLHPRQPQPPCHGRLESQSGHQQGKHCCSSFATSHLVLECLHDSDNRLSRICRFGVCFLGMFTVLRMSSSCINGQYKDSQTHRAALQDLPACVQLIRGRHRSSQTCHMGCCIGHSLGLFRLTSKYTILSLSISPFTIARLYSRHSHQDKGGQQPVAMQARLCLCLLTSTGHSPLHALRQRELGQAKYCHAAADMSAQHAILLNMSGQHATLLIHPFNSAHAALQV